MANWYSRAIQQKQETQGSSPSAPLVDQEAERHAAQVVMNVKTTLDSVSKSLQQMERAQQSNGLGFSGGAAPGNGNKTAATAAAKTAITTAIQATDELIGDMAAELEVQPTLKR